MGVAVEKEDLGKVETLKTEMLNTEIGRNRENSQRCPLVASANVALQTASPRIFLAAVGDGSKPDLLPVQNRTIC